MKKLTWPSTPVTAHLLFWLATSSACFATPGNSRAIVCDTPLTRHLAFPPSAHKILRVAAVQYPIAGAVPYAQFIENFEARVREARLRGRDLIVFPELIALDLMRGPEFGSDEKQLLNIAKSITPKFFARVTDLARKYRISILAGSWPRLESAGRVHNSALLAFPDGRRILQDKIFLTPEEKAWNWKAGTLLKVFEAPWGRTVILICFDCEMPILSESLVRERPEVILVPSMTGAAGFTRVRWAAQARAVEHHAYVLHTGTAPTAATPGDYYSQASLLGPQESHFPSGAMAEGKTNSDETLEGELNISLLRASRQTAGRMDPAKEEIERSSPINVRRVFPDEVRLEFAQPVRSLAMNFDYGSNGALPKRFDIRATNTFDAIVDRQRTATSREDGSLDSVKVGDELRIIRGNFGDQGEAIVRVKEKRAVRDLSPEEWARPEGYDPVEASKNWDGGLELRELQFQIIFELVAYRRTQFEEWKLLE